MEQRVIIITGPTNSGKTTFSIELAKKLDTEIISADSRQVYKYLDIGTAKPTGEELAEVKHHLVDFLEPEEPYNASRFEHDALEISGRLTGEGKIPVVCGGTGLYIKALTEGIFDTVDTDEEYRAVMHEIIKREGYSGLYDILKEKDPETAATMLPQNWKRVMRALEVLHLSGKSIREHHREQKRETDYNFIKFALYTDRELLYQNIEKRVDRMIEAGLVEEVKALLDKGYSKDLNALNTVGYKEIIAYLEGDVSLDRAIDLIKRNTRRYAKRQLTWIRGDKNVHWLRIDGKEDIPGAVRVVLGTAGY